MKVPFRRALRSSCMIFIRFSLMAGLSACSVQPPQPDVTAQVAEYFRYTIVRPGINLRIVSLWYCEREDVWNQFFIPASRSTTTLRQGDVILIPRNLLTREDPIADGFIEAKQPTNTSRTNSPTSSRPPNEPPDALPVDPEENVQEEFLNTFSEPLNSPSVP